ncbi:hypothetical protein glysoja_048483 [Glycine soja]|uniref:Uncharacterized protein n=1 Tax=Glycine soja TaxID=3848 RepID=A0A0B2SBC9_GLYSO|nr:hypothetical protein glysoja_048483 [Glycine soja]
MLNYIRCMSSSKLFIGGLSYGVDDQSLKDASSGFGYVVDGKFYLISLLSHGAQFQPPASLTLPYVL